jgi:hypothetical protein
MVSLCLSGRAFVTSAPERLRSCRSSGGKASEETPRSGRRRSLLDSRTPPPEIIDVSPVATRVLASASLILRGLGRREGHSLIKCPGGALASVQEFPCIPGPSPSIFQHMHDRVASVHTPHPPVVYAARGRMYELCAFKISLGTLPKAACRKHGTDRGRGWVNTLIESPLRMMLVHMLGKKMFIENPPYRVSDRGGRSYGIPPLDRVAPSPEILHRHALLLASPPWGTRASHGLSTATERPALALLPGCLPPAPTPSASSYPPVLPSSPPKNIGYRPPP